MRRSGLSAAAVTTTAAAFALAFTTESTGSAVQRGPAFPGGAYFNLVCGFSHQNNDDPIRFPEQPGRSHNHTYIGNRVVHAFSTPATLRQRSESTCEVEADGSTYWVPTLYEGTRPVVPYAGVVYYVPHPAAGVRVPGRLEDGRREPDRQARAEDGHRLLGLRWHRDEQAVRDRARVQARRRPRAPRALPGLLERQDVGQRQPQESHGLRSCRALSLLAPRGRADASRRAPVPARPETAVLSSGRFAAHADFMNGWDPDALQKLVAGLNY